MVQILKYSDAIAQDVAMAIRNYTQQSPQESMALGLIFALLFVALGIYAMYLDEVE